MKKIVFMLLMLSIASFGKGASYNSKGEPEVEVKTYVNIIGNGLIILSEDNTKEVFLEHEPIFLSEGQPTSIAEKKIEIRMGTHGRTRHLPEGTKLEIELISGSNGNNLASTDDAIPHVLKMDINEKSVEIKENTLSDNIEVITDGSETVATISSIIDPSNLDQSIDEGIYRNTSTLKVTIVSD